MFDSQYYDSIWGGVHRHDYCPYWADRIVTEHGKCRILDVGTGCGYLVKLLRDRGCDAWGVDSSDYAIANCCAPGYVVKGSVTYIPFKDDSFDIVFSNGLWSYVAEEDVPKGRDEIWRVGAKQIHNIDHDRTDYMEAFVTWKSQAWWDEALAASKVLVSCPTHQCKEYAHRAWLDNVAKIDYSNYEVYVVDNSPTPDCSKRWGFDWLKCEGDICQRMATCMELVRRKFLAGNYKWWFNLEIDVIPDPGMLKLLIKFDGDWLGHAFPDRGCIGNEISSGIGCTLWSRKLIEDFSFTDKGICNGSGIDGLMWNWVRPQGKYKTHEIWSHLPIQHLKEPEGIPYG